MGGRHRSAAPAAPHSPSPAALRRVLLNTLALVLAYGMPRVLTFGAVVVAARALGTAAFGAYGTAAATAVILSILATLGMTPLLVRDIARAPERAGALIRAAHRVKTVAVVVMLASLFALTRWILGFPPNVVAAAMLLGVSYAIAAYAENLAAYFQAVERMHVWTQASAAFGVVSGGLGAALVAATASLTWFCVAPIAGQAAALAWLLVRAPAEVRAGRAASRDDVARLLRALAPFAAAFVLLTVYYKVDVLLLARWRTAAEVGIYAAAYKFIDIVHALAIVAVAAVYPRLSRAAPRTAPGGGWAARRLAELTLLAAVPAGALLWLLRAPLIDRLYGEAYAAAAVVLGVLAPVVPALALNLFAGYILGAAGRMYIVAMLYGAAVLVNIGLNAAFIPAHGATGAAVAMLGSELLLAAAMLVVLRRAAAAPGARSLAIAAGAAAACGVLAPVDGAVWAGAGYAGLVLALYAAAGAVPAGERAALRRAAFGPAPSIPGPGGGAVR